MKISPCFTRLWNVRTAAAAISLLLGSAAAAPRTAFAQQDQPVHSEKSVVVVDAGHGGRDNGAVGARGVREKDINLAVARALRQILVQSGLSVRMTRDGDTFVPLNARSNKADYFLSLHANQPPTQGRPATEATVYHHGQDGPSRDLAAKIAQETEPVLNATPVFVRSDSTIYPKGFSVLRNSSIPSVLVSLGDMNKLVNPKTQWRAAQAIADGLRDFIAASSADRGTVHQAPHTTAKGESR